MAIFDDSVEGEVFEDDGIDYSAFSAYEKVSNIECFDNTMLATYRECPRKFYWSIMRGFEPRRKSAALSFGSAWHKFLEHYLRDGDWKRALVYASQLFMEANVPEDKTRNLSTLAILAERYANIFSHNEYEVIDTEIFGAIMIGDFLYGAKIDALVTDQKRLKGIEHKTTSRMEATFFDMWRMSTQTRGYFTVLRTMHPETSGLLLNAAHIVKEPDFHRDELTWSRAQIEDWTRTTIDTHTELVTEDHKQCWRQHTDACVGKYGACPFLQLCLEPKRFTDVVPMKAYYQPRKWDPFHDELHPEEKADGTQ